MKNKILIIVSFLVLFSCGSKEETVKVNDKTKKIITEYISLLFKYSTVNGVDYDIESIEGKNITEKDSLYFQSLKILVSNKSKLEGNNFFGTMKNVEGKMVKQLGQKNMLDKNYVSDWDKDFNRSQNKLNVDEILESNNEAHKISELSSNTDDKIVLYQIVRVKVNTINKGEKKVIYLFFHISKDFKIMDSPLKLTEYIYNINKNLEKEEGSF